MKQSWTDGLCFTVLHVLSLQRCTHKFTIARFTIAILADCRRRKLPQGNGH